MIINGIIDMTITIIVTEPSDFFISEFVPKSEKSADLPCLDGKKISIVLSCAIRLFNRILTACGR